MSIALEYILKQIAQQPVFRIRGNDFAAQRAYAEDPQNQLPLPEGISAERRLFGNVPCEILVPHPLKSENLILYIHGGGFCTGSEIASRGYGGILAEMSGMRVVTVGYRLAPENPYPAGVDDCFQVYCALREAFPGKKIAMIGESAGATMILVTALKAKYAEIPQPSCMVSCSACTNFAEDLPSHSQNRGALVVADADIREQLCQVYLSDGIDPTIPYVSPYYGDFSGTCPIWFWADQGEILFDDTEQLASHLQKSGLPVTLRTSEGTFHAFPSIGNVCPESKQLNEEIIAFMMEYNM